MDSIYHLFDILIDLISVIFYSSILCFKKIRLIYSLSWFSLHLEPRLNKHHKGVGEHSLFSCSLKAIFDLLGLQNQAPGLYVFACVYHNN